MAGRRERVSWAALVAVLAVAVTIAVLRMQDAPRGAPAADGEIVGDRFYLDSRIDGTFRRRGSSVRPGRRRILRRRGDDGQRVAHAGRAVRAGVVGPLVPSLDTGTARLTGVVEVRTASTETGFSQPDTASSAITRSTTQEPGR